MQRGLIARSRATAINGLMGLLLAIAVLAGSGGGSVVFAAQEAAREAVAYDYDIASAPADQALIEFARQTKGMQLSVLVPSGDFARILTNPVHGHYRPDEALSVLLRDTGLSGSIGATGIVAVTRIGEQDMGRKKSRWGWVGGVLGFIGGHLFVPGASAQTSPAPESADAAAAPQELEQITVTGSRVISNGNDSPTPVTVVNLDQLQQMNPGPLTQALAMLPELLATPNQGGQGPTPQAVFNLRGIGGTRNLILFDDHRVAPTTNGATEGVDSNLLPQLLLKRVDVVTGGASAVYGSDAVSGVINYVVDHDFNGLKVVGQAGESTYSDDHTWNAGFAAGTPLFDGRGHAEFSFQDFNDPGIENRFSRPWGQGLWSMQGSVPGSAATAGTAGNPFALYSNTRLSVTSFGGLINSGPLSGLQFAQNGALSPFVHGAATGTPGVEIGGNGAYYSSTWAWARQDMDQAFGRFDYDLTDNVKAYAELAFGSVLYVTNDHSANAEVRTKAVGYNNAFLSTVQPTYQAAIASQLAANPLSSFNFSRIFTGDQFPAPIDYTRENQYLFITGLDGKWGQYTWKISYDRQDSVSDADDPNNLNNGRLYAAMNAVVNPATGQTVCHAALVNAAYANCVPLNLFGPTASSQAAFNYIRQDTRSSTTYLMDDVTASIAGAPLSDWAGPLDMAVSAEWRKLSYRVLSNALPTDAVDCAGIQFNCNSGTSPYFATTTADFEETSERVAELGYEAEIPLLVDKFLAKSLALNAAARYTDYQTSGTVWTWKVGGTWEVNDEFRLRGTRSRDIRAPGLVDLYQPATVAVTNITDIHTGVTGPVNSVTVGNPNLTPEIADTWTGGFVWRPHFIDGASLSLDYYHINIRNGLTTPAARQPATMLACENSGGTSPICALYVRPYPFSDTSANNFPTEIINQELNTAGLLTYGADGEIDYSHLLFGHNFMMRVLANYQPHLIYNFGPAGTVDVGGAADGVGGLPPTPNVKGVFELNYEVLRSLAVTVQERYRNALKQNGSPLILFAVGKLPPAFYTDLTLNYKPNVGAGNLETYFVVRNLFNHQPAPWASSGGGSEIGEFGGWAQGDDPIGRYFTLGFRYKL